jgi:perosamine synthetase
MGHFHGLDLPVSSRIARRGFYLPSGLGLGEDEIDRTASELAAALAKNEPQR